jgi:hypothetical protein
VDTGFASESTTKQKNLESLRFRLNRNDSSLGDPFVMGREAPGKFHEWPLNATVADVGDDKGQSRGEQGEAQRREVVDLGLLYSARGQKDQTEHRKMHEI